jgi:hypothetical protein
VCAPRRWRRLCSQVDQDGPAASAAAGLDVVENVAEEPGAHQVEAELGGCLEDQARLRFTAATRNGQLRNGAFRMVRAVEDGVEGY